MLNDLEVNKVDATNIVDGFSRDHFENERRKLVDLVGLAILVSEKSGGINTSGRFVRTVQVYTRLVAALMTFSRIIPGNCHCQSDHEFWDWPSVAVLARNIMEIYNVFYYTGVEKITDEDVYFRYLLMQYHRNLEKYKFYKEFGAPQEDLQSFEDNIPKAKEELKKCAKKIVSDEKLLKKILGGSLAMHKSHTEIDKTAKVLGEYFKPFYRLFSNHVHSTPFSFLAISNERGRGEENKPERFYIILAMQVVISYVSTAILDMREIFPDQFAKPYLIPFLERARRYKENQNCIYEEYPKIPDKPSAYFSKLTNTGINLNSAFLANYGFSQGDEFKVSCLEEGKIVLEKKTS